MAWYQCDSILEVLCVAADYPDGVVSMAPWHKKLFNLQELVLDPKAFKNWVQYESGSREISTRRAHLSLFTDYQSALGKRYDSIHNCAGCGLPMLDHPRSSIMDAPLLERLAFCLRAHHNAEKQGRTVSDTVKRIGADALNEYEVGKLQDAEDAPIVLARIGDDHA